MYEKRQTTQKTCLVVAFIILALGVDHTAKAKPAPIICPTELSANNLGEFQLIGAIPSFGSLFYTLNIIEGEPGDEARYAPVALVPDVDGDTPKNKTDIWNLAPHDTPMLMICSYQGTSTYLRAVIPPSVNHCTLTISKNPPMGQCW